MFICWLERSHRKREVDDADERGEDCRESVLVFEWVTVEEVSCDRYTDSSFTELGGKAG